MKTFHLPKNFKRMNTTINLTENYLMDNNYKVVYDKKPITDAEIDKYKNFNTVKGKQFGKFYRFTGFGTLKKAFAKRPLIASGVILLLLLGLVALLSLFE